MSSFSSRLSFLLSILRADFPQLLPCETSGARVHRSPACLSPPGFAGASLAAGVADLGLFPSPPLGSSPCAPVFRLLAPDGSFSDFCSLD